MLEFTIKVPMQIAAIEVDDLQVTKQESAFEKLQTCADSYRERFGDRPTGNVEGIEAGRQLFKALGMDPDQLRQSLDH